MKISAVVLTKNEEKNIKECLESLSWCDEIVVIDDYSVDKTVEVAQKMGVKVFTRSLNDDFAAQRNFGLKKAKGDWVLFVDADERISTALAAEIKSQISIFDPPAGGEKTSDASRVNLKAQSYSLKLKANQPVGFYLKRKDFIWGRWIQHGDLPRQEKRRGLIRVLRLGRKGVGYWKRPIHEAWQIKGKIGELKNPLLHYPHPTAFQFLKEINQYSTIRARELYKKGKKTNFFEIIAFPMGKFFKNFIWNLGFLDGLPGFLYAIFMSFHSFLTRGKLFLLWQKK